MKTKSIALLLALVMLAAVTLFGCGKSSASDDTSATVPNGTLEVPENLEMNWNGSTESEQVKHHTYADYQNLMEELVKTYPDYCKLYSIGHTSQERQLWCL